MKVFAVKLFTIVALLGLTINSGRADVISDREINRVYGFKATQDRKAKYPLQAWIEKQSLRERVLAESAGKADQQSVEHYLRYRLGSWVPTSNYLTHAEMRSFIRDQGDQVCRDFGLEGSLEPVCDTVELALIKEQAWDYFGELKVEKAQAQLAKFRRAQGDEFKFGHLARVHALLLEGHSSSSARLDAARKELSQRKELDRDRMFGDLIKLCEGTIHRGTLTDFLDAFYRNTYNYSSRIRSQDPAQFEDQICMDLAWQGALQSGKVLERLRDSGIPSPVIQFGQGNAATLLSWFQYSPEGPELFCSGTVQQLQETYLSSESFKHRLAAGEAEAVRVAVYQEIQRQGARQEKIAQLADEIRDRLSAAGRTSSEVGAAVRLLSSGGEVSPEWLSELFEPERAASSCGGLGDDLGAR